MGARMIVLTPIDGDPGIQEFALRPLIITTVDRRDKIGEVLHVKKHEVICDLCRGLIALTKKELEERANPPTILTSEGLAARRPGFPGRLLFQSLY